MARVSRSELVDAAAAGMNLHRNEVEFVLERMLHFIGEALKSGETVKLQGFGSFQVRQRATRRARNPLTGEVLTVSERRVAFFAPSEKLSKKFK